MTSNDLPNVVNFLKEHKCLILQEDVKHPDQAFIDDVSKLQDMKVYKVYLTNNYYKPDVYLSYVESRNSYYVDIDRSFALEFVLGGMLFNDKELQRSRLYFTTSYYVGEEKIKKDEPFIKWCGNIMKGFKKQFLKKPPFDTFVYFTNNAFEWQKTSFAEISRDHRLLVLK